MDVLAEFREQLYQCMTRRADALFELTEALLCTDEPVKTLVGLSLAPEHRRRRGAMYDALNHGCIDVGSLRRQVAGLPLPRAADGRVVLVVDVSPWLHPDSAGPVRPMRVGRTLNPAADGRARWMVATAGPQACRPAVQNPAYRLLVKTECAVQSAPSGRRSRPHPPRAAS